jgi:hypothetical protein
MAKEIDNNSFWIYEGTPISSVGVYPYLGRQISTELEADKVYFVYRPAEELNKKKTVESFKLLPVVNGHRDPKTAQLHGTSSESVYFDGDKLKADLKIFTESLQNEIKNGKKEISIGYKCRYEDAKGIYNGSKYDFIQRNIRGNHIALVEKGRCGAEVAVQDKKLTWDTAEGMPSSVLIIDGHPQLFKNSFVKKPDIPLYFSVMFNKTLDRISAVIKKAEDIIFNETEHPRDKKGQFKGCSNRGKAGKKTAVEAAAQTDKPQKRMSEVIKITGQELGEYKDIKDLREKAVKYYKDNLQGTKVIKKELGEVLFSRKGLKKFNNTSPSEYKLKMVAAIKDVIKKGEYKGREELTKERDDGIIAFHRVNSLVSILDSKPFEVSVIIYEDEYGNKFYNLNDDVEAYKKKTETSDGAAEEGQLPNVSVKPIIIEKIKKSKEYNKKAEYEEIGKKAAEFFKRKNEVIKRSVKNMEMLLGIA